MHEYMNDVWESAIFVEGWSLGYSQGNIFLVGRRQKGGPMKRYLEAHWRVFVSTHLTSPMPSGP